MTSGFYNYQNLARAATQYSRRMERLRCRIFSECSPEAGHGERRIVRMFSEPVRYKMPSYVEYYPRLRETYHLMVRLRQLGLYRDEHEDFKEEMKRLRTLRGKGSKLRAKQNK